MGAQNPENLLDGKGNQLKKGEATRHSIIVKTAPVFNQRGFAGCSMQDLMEAAGLEKGGIYRHFSSKEELAAEAFKYSIELALDARMRSFDQLEGSITRLKHLVSAFVEVPAPIAGGCPLMNVAADIDFGSKLVAEHARTAIGVWKSKLCAIVAEGKDTHELRQDIEPTKVANLLISTLEGALMISRLEGNRQALLDAKNALYTFLTSLELTDPESH
jgi:AcrR family transcriptional regulator